MEVVKTNMEMIKIVNNNKIYVLTFENGFYKAKLDGVVFAKDRNYEKVRSEFSEVFFKESL